MSSGHVLPARAQGRSTGRLPASTAGEQIVTEHQRAYERGAGDHRETPQAGTDRSFKPLHFKSPRWLQSESDRQAFPSLRTMQNLFAVRRAVGRISCGGRRRAPRSKQTARVTLRVRSIAGTAMLENQQPDDQDSWPAVAFDYPLTDLLPRRDIAWSRRSSPSIHFCAIIILWFILRRLFDI